MPDTDVRILGSGDAFSAGGRHQAAYMISTGNSSILLDCGATALASLKQHRLNPETIDTIILSHLHGDHFCGLPFLFLEYSFETPRHRPLRIGGPPGTGERVRQLFATVYRDLASRPLPFALEFIEFTPDQTVELDGVRVTPFQVPHQENAISLGIGIDTGRHRILYSGDTGWTEELIKHARGTDLFICECSYFETRRPFHLDYPRLMENSARFGTSRLVLTHLGREVLARRQEIELELATDGLAITLR